jgi:hypothetical protein
MMRSGAIVQSNIDRRGAIAAFFHPWFRPLLPILMSGTAHVRAQIETIPHDINCRPPIRSKTRDKPNLHAVVIAVYCHSIDIQALLQHITTSLPI